MTDATVPALPAAPPDRPQARLDEALRDGVLGGFKALSDVAACLMPLLKAIGWRGNTRRLAEALPHLSDNLDVDGLRAVLANLNYLSRQAKVRLGDLDPKLLPCLFVPSVGSAMVVLRRDEAGFAVYVGTTNAVTNIQDQDTVGTAYFFTASEGAPAGARANFQNTTWFQTIARRFRGLIWLMLGITLANSLLALAVPLFTMAVYDWVIPGKSLDTLAHLFIAVFFALGCDAGLRVIRARVLAYVGGRIDMILGAAAFQQILHLPAAMTESAAIGAQLTRLRQFESVREFFTGPLASVFLDLPFTAIFVATIAWIAGPLAWIPVVLMVVFLLMAWITIPLTRRFVSEAGQARSRKQSFLIEMLTHFRSIKQSSAEAIWSSRYRDLSARASIANFRTTQVSLTIQTLAQLLMMSAGIATLAFGTLRVLDNEMSIGALIASMALIWRVLAPLQLGFLSLTRLEQIKLGLTQMNQLMRLKLEREPGHTVERHRTLKGEIAFRRVSLRYTQQSEPALFGAAFDVGQGELVAITGASGSGKSTILKLVAGLYQAQSGAVLVDGIDIRQLDCSELREAIAYVPQQCHLFHGTIAQNLRLANPTASNAELAQAAVDSGLMDDILRLPEGFETRLTDQVQRQLPSGLKQRLLLARAYVKQAPIYLLDEPANNLDAEGDRMLMRKLQQLRGRATVLVATHRPSHMHLADRLIFLDQGHVLLDGSPQEVLPKLNAA